MARSGAATGVFAGIAEVEIVPAYEGAGVRVVSMVKILNDAGNSSVTPTIQVRSALAGDGVSELVQIMPAVAIAGGEHVKEDGRVVGLVNGQSIVGVLATEPTEDVVFSALWVDLA